MFKDERENLRVGKFTDVDEVLKFMEYIREREEKENAWNDKSNGGEKFAGRVHGISDCWR